MWEEEQICPSCCRNSRYGLRHKYCKGDIEGLTCLWSYNGITKKIISNAKYRYLYDQLGELVKLDERVELEFFRRFLEEKPIVVPVPLHPKRLRERGFNQAAVAASLFANRYSLIVDNLLVRIRETPQQVGRTREERLRAMEGAFRISNYSNYSNSPKNILLVDDVWTTGATLRECAKTLKKAGVENIWGFVLAR